MEIVLFEPEIPQNTGNIARTCAALGASLVLIRPLGFSLSSRFIKRAGMDYLSLISIKIEDSLDEYLLLNQHRKIYFLSTKGSISYDKIEYDNDVILVFGSESKGLPSHIYEQKKEQLFTIPMKSNCRSLNLANTVAIVSYDMCRKSNFNCCN